MSQAQPLGRLSRTVAGLIGIIWMAAGLAAIGLGAVAREWGSVLLGVLAVYFGGIWWQVARTGRYLVWPFRRRR